MTGFALYFFAALGFMGTAAALGRVTQIVLNYLTERTRYYRAAAKVEAQKEHELTDG